MHLKKSAVLLCITATMGMVGCEYTDVTIDSVDTAYTFDTVEFDTLMSHGEAKEEMRYSWDFGDGTSATGDSPSHIYGQAGTYTVTLTSTDTYTKEIKTTQKEVVIASPASSLSNQVTVNVSNTFAPLEYNYIQNATVTINGVQATTNDNGFAIFDNVDADNKVLVEVTAEGYHSQSIQLEPNHSTDNRDISITLSDEGESQTVADISQASSVSYSPSITDKNINLTVTFDENSFVTKDGTVATGATDVRIKPWNPSNRFDMSAFLGDGVAIDNMGDYTQLVSYGAMTVEFSQNGEKLQLAPGKYATISMPLSLDTHYDGRPIVAGDTIPMWYFAENTGAWMQEDNLMGEVVTDETGRLALKAQVSHFTTWNWDMKFENPSSLFIQCQLPDSTPVPCNVKASFYHPNAGFSASKQDTISADGTTVVNIDPNVNVTLSASYYDDATGTRHFTNQSVQGSSNSVILTLDNKDKPNNILLYSFIDNTFGEVPFYLHSIEYTDIDGNTRLLTDNEFELNKLYRYGEINVILLNDLKGLFKINYYNSYKYVFRGVEEGSIPLPKELFNFRELDLSWIDTIDGIQFTDNTDKQRLLTEDEFEVLYDQNGMITKVLLTADLEGFFTIYDPENKLQYNPPGVFVE